MQEQRETFNTPLSRDEHFGKSKYKYKMKGSYKNKWIKFVFALVNRNVSWKKLKAIYAFEKDQITNVSLWDKLKNKGKYSGVQHNHKNECALHTLELKLMLNDLEQSASCFWKFGDRNSETATEPN